MKRALRRLLLGPRSIPQYAAVGVTDPQAEIAVRLHGISGIQDVTGNNVVASLRPFLIALTLQDELVDIARRRSLRLTFHDRHDQDRELGRVVLRLQRSFQVDGHQYCIFRPTRYRNRCLPPVRLRMHYLYQFLRNLSNRDPYNFRMGFRDLHRFWIFYTCPRPVALVSVQSGARGNLFPMDLIGPTDGHYFSLALRNTSPSVSLIKESGRIALSRIPLAFTDFAYQLGVHHKKNSIDWDALPFDVGPSPTFGLPVPIDALGISELSVEQSHTVGSHTVFLAHVQCDEQRAEGLRMSHVQGFFQEYLERKGRALTRFRRDAPTA